MKRKLTLWLVFSLLFLSFSITGCAAQAAATPAGKTCDEIQRITVEFTEAMFVAAYKFYRPLTDEDLQKLKEYLRAYFPLYLDPHAALLSKEEAKALLESSFVGIGIHVSVCPEITKKRLERLSAIKKELLSETLIKKIEADKKLHDSAGKFLMAASPEYGEIIDDLINGRLNEKGVYLGGIISGSPAEKSGLTKDYRGWYIVKIGESKTAGRNLPEIVDLIRGETDTSVSIVIVSPDGSETKTFAIVRGAIATAPLESRIIPGTDIGYIKIPAFHVEPEVFAKACAELKKAGARALIIDLNNNPGGDLRQTLGIANLFVDKGQTLLYTKGRNEIYIGYEAYQEKAFNWPIAVLINENSASASEVLAGILKDYGLATIIGEKSYGKGSVQGFHELTLNDSVMKITMYKYYSPVTKTCPDGIGISPDIEIKDDPTTEENEPLQKAVEVLKEKLRKK